MEYLKELFERRNMVQLTLVILFIIYLLTGSETPESVANIVDTMAGKIVVMMVALMLFAYSNPILGVLGLLVAYNVLKNASMSSSLMITPSLDSYYPTEQKVWSPFTPTHQFPYTLEQEVVKEMAPHKFNTVYESPSFKPALDDIHDAASVNYNGVV